jgi:hypothetical protein
MPLEEYLKEAAQEAYDCGHPMDPDDFEEFRKICEEDGYTVTRTDFNTYFKLFDEIRNENNY